jgi:hypothetical protein
MDSPVSNNSIGLWVSAIVSPWKVAFICRYDVFMRRVIVGFYKDECGDWVAKLNCGHGQHVRHNPPWQNRTWVQTDSGRQSRLGLELNCKKCDEHNATDKQ